MSYHPLLLGVQVQLEPAKATTIILEMFRKSGANVCIAAERLGVTERTLHRYIMRLGIKSKIGTIRERASLEGWLKSARWPDEKRKKDKRPKQKPEKTA